MLTLKLDETEFTCEANWDQLSKERLLGLMRVLSEPGHPGKRMWAVVRYMLKLKHGTGAVKDDKTAVALNLPAIWVHHIYADPECLGWINEESRKLTEYLVQGFRHRGRYYTGPPKRIMRIPIVEYVVIVISLIQYKKTGKIDAIDEVIATLYRPVNPLSIFGRWRGAWNGDRRMPLNDFTTKRRKKRFATLDVALKMAILKQVSGGVKLLEEKYPLVFAQTEESNGSDDGRGLLNLLFAMSNGVFGDLRKTEMADTTEVFMKLEMDIKEMLRMKDRLKA